ncbi:MAG: hypothetical protein OXC07_02685, partial [Kistimonas sp.]|nr:hypothetical protein [Kistimonas sp.]
STIWLSTRAGRHWVAEVGESQLAGLFDTHARAPGGLDAVGPVSGGMATVYALPTGGCAVGAVLCERSLPGSWCMPHAPSLSWCEIRQYRPVQVPVETGRRC